MFPTRRTVSFLLVIATAGCAKPSENRTPVAAATPAAPAAPAAAAPGSDLASRRAALTALLDEQWQYRLRRRPELASRLGDPRYNDRWTDSSPEAIQADLVAVRGFLTRFEAIDPTGLPEQEALSHRLMVRQLRQDLEDARFESWLMPIDQLNGIHVSLPQLVPQLRFATVKDYDDYLKRLDAVPTVLAQAIALARTGASKHLVPPRFLIEKAAAQALEMSKVRAEDSPFALPVKTFAAGISAADQPRLRAAVLAAIKDKILPAYAAFAAFAKDEYAAQGRSEVGEWSLPDGAARYAQDVKDATTTSLSPDEIHDIGLREVARIEGEVAKVATKLGFKNVQALRAKVRADRALFAKGREDILARYRVFTDQMYQQLPRLFGRLPAQKLIVLPVEEFRETGAPGAAYFRGTRDGARPGAMRINTGDATQRSLTEIETTAYHEGVPGHHLQTALAQELPDLPPFRQQGRYVAFGEGWALYAESLGEEVGLFQDPYSLYGHLQAEMMRAIRLVVDTGLHHKRWSRDKVVAFFHDHSTLDEPTVQSETDRYIVMPSQALGYKIGQLTILRLRREAEAALGPAFDVRAFHDAVLAAGSLPLDVLEERIHAWVEAQKKG